MEVTPLLESDAEEVAEMENHLFENAFGAYVIRREIQLGWGLALRDEGRVIGYALCRDVENETDILRLGIDKSYQGKGLGRKLLLAVLEKAKSSVMLTVRKTNIPALKLYQSAGFRTVGWLPAQDAKIMRRLG